MTFWGDAIVLRPDCQEEASRDKIQWKSISSKENHKSTSSEAETSLESEFRKKTRVNKVGEKGRRWLQMEVG